MDEKTVKKILGIIIKADEQDWEWERMGKELDAALYSEPQVVCPKPEQRYDPAIVRIPVPPTPASVPLPPDELLTELREIIAENQFDLDWDEENNFAIANATNGDWNEQKDEWFRGHYYKRADSVIKLIAAIKVKIRKDALKEVAQYLDHFIGKANIGLDETDESSNYEYNRRITEEFIRLSESLKTGVI